MLALGALSSGDRKQTGHESYEHLEECARESDVDETLDQLVNDTVTET